MAVREKGEGNRNGGFSGGTLKALSNYANSRLKKKKERKKIFSSEAIKCFHYLMKAHLVKLSSLSQKMTGLSLTSHLQGRGHAQWG